MKFAITCENGQLFQHFGRTPEFAVYTLDSGRLSEKTLLPCNGTGHGALAGLLKEAGIDLLICGGIGGGAQNALAEAGIRLIGGASGNVDEIAAAFASGSLKVNADFQCHHHHHGEGESCGAHGCH